jgi:hypothetical protein
MKKNTEALVISTKEGGLEINTTFICHQQNAGTNHNTVTANALEMLHSSTIWQRH